MPGDREARRIARRLLAQRIRPVNGPTQVRVFSVDTDARPAEVEAISLLLTPAERTEARAIRQGSVCASFVIRRAARVHLVRGLGHPNDRGSIASSFSSSDGLALLAFADTCLVGVDVERSRKTGNDLLPIAYDALSGAEQRMLAETFGANRNRTFLALWTLKEALCKAEGTGLSDLVRSRCVAAAAQTDVSRPAVINGWRLARLDVGRKWCASIAWREATPANIRQRVESFAW